VDFDSHVHCAALLRLTPSLSLQVHYSCMLRDRRRELRRCITFGNYHVKPQSPKARLWLVDYNKFRVSVKLLLIILIRILKSLKKACFSLKIILSLYAFENELF